MLEDVFSAVGESKLADNKVAPGNASGSFLPIWSKANCRKAEEMALEEGFDVIREETQLGESSSVDLALQVCRKMGAKSVLVIRRNLFSAAERRPPHNRRGSRLRPGKGTKGQVRYPRALRRRTRHKRYTEKAARQHTLDVRGRQFQKTQGGSGEKIRALCSHSVSSPVLPWRCRRLQKFQYQHRYRRTRRHRNFFPLRFSH